MLEILELLIFLFILIAPFVVFITSIRSLIFYRRHLEERTTEKALKYSVAGLVLQFLCLVGITYLSYQLYFVPVQTESILGAAVAMLFLFILIILLFLASVGGLLFSLIYQPQIKKWYIKIKLLVAILLLVISAAIPLTFSYVKSSQDAQREKERKLRVGAIGGISQEQAKTIAEKEIGPKVMHNNTTIKMVDNYSNDFAVWDYSTTLLDKNYHIVIPKNISINAKDGSIVRVEGEKKIEFVLLKGNKPLGGAEVFLEVIRPGFETKGFINDYTISDELGRAYITASENDQNDIYVRDVDKTFKFSSPLQDSYTVNIDNI